MRAILGCSIIIFVVGMWAGEWLRSRSIRHGWTIYDTHEDEKHDQ